ncbi:hypothetical protein P7C70_g7828, partial [Phenoliferia sp. Uapishka_3]
MSDHNIQAIARAFEGCATSKTFLDDLEKGLLQSWKMYEISRDFLGDKKKMAAVKSIDFKFIPANLRRLMPPDFLATVCQRVNHLALGRRGIATLEVSEQQFYRLYFNQLVDIHGLLPRVLLALEAGNGPEHDEYSFTQQHYKTAAKSFALTSLGTDDDPVPAAVTREMNNHELTERTCLRSIPVDKILPAAVQSVEVMSSDNAAGAAEVSKPPSFVLAYYAPAELEVGDHEEGVGSTLDSLARPSNGCFPDQVSAPCSEEPPRAFDSSLGRKAIEESATQVRLLLMEHGEDSTTGKLVRSISTKAHKAIEESYVVGKERLDDEESREEAVNEMSFPDGSVHDGTNTVGPSATIGARRIDFRAKEALQNLIELGSYKALILSRGPPDHLLSKLDKFLRSLCVFVSLALVLEEVFPVLLALEAASRELREAVAAAVGTDHATGEQATELRILTRNVNGMLDYALGAFVMASVNRPRSKDDVEKWLSAITDPRGYLTGERAPVHCFKEDCEDALLLPSATALAKLPDLVKLVKLAIVINPSNFAKFELIVNTVSYLSRLSPTSPP